jgi:hypothetical protein
MEHPEIRIFGEAADKMNGANRCLIFALPEPSTINCFYEDITALPETA